MGSQPTANPLPSLPAHCQPTANPLPSLPTSLGVSTRVFAAAKLLSDDWYAGTGVNSWEVMQPRLQRCWRQLAARFGYDFSFPNIVVVNYYELGDPMAVVDWLNTQRGQVTPLVIPLVIPLAIPNPSIYHCCQGKPRRGPFHRVEKWAGFILQPTTPSRPPSSLRPSFRPPPSFLIFQPHEVCCA